MEHLLTFVSILLGGGILTTVQFFINRHDQKAEKRSGILQAIESLKTEVVKVSDVFENDVYVKNGQTSNEKLWIPSAYEMFGGLDHETEGCTYSDFFKSLYARLKIFNNSINNAYMLRSAYSSLYFYCVSNSGALGYNNNASNSGGLVFGFCL